MATLIESALVYQNTANYEMSIKTFEDAELAWIDIVGEREKMRLEVLLFF